MIPCVKNKCICYPACKSKHVIDCPDLLKYYNDTAPSGVTIHKFLPNVCSITNKDSHNDKTYIKFGTNSIQYGKFAIALIDDEVVST